MRGSQTLNEICSKLQAKYMPSIDAEARKLWSRFREEEGATEERREVVRGRELGSGGDRGSDSRC